MHDIAAGPDFPAGLAPPQPAATTAIDGSVELRGCSVAALSPVAIASIRISARRAQPSMQAGVPWVVALCACATIRAFCGSEPAQLGGALLPRRALGSS